MTEIHIRTVKDKECRDVIRKYVWPETRERIGIRQKETRLLCIMCIGDETIEGFDDALAQSIKMLIDQTINVAKEQTDKPQVLV